MIQINFEDENVQELERIVKQAYQLACDGNNDALVLLKPLCRKEIFNLQQAIFGSIYSDLAEAQKRKSKYELE